MVSDFPVSDHAVPHSTYKAREVSESGIFFLSHLVDWDCRGKSMYMSLDITGLDRFFLATLVT